MNAKETIFYHPNNYQESTGPYRIGTVFYTEGERKFIRFMLSHDILFSGHQVNILLVPNDNSDFVKFMKNTTRGFFNEGRKILDFFRSPRTNLELRLNFKGSYNALLIKDTKEIEKFGK